MNARSLMLHAVAACAALAVLMPASAGAYATVAAPPLRSGVSGLPDGRVYEEVSPPNKYGNEVFANQRYWAVAASGEDVMYSGTGALAEQASGGMRSSLYASRRTGDGWITRSAMPLPWVGSKSEEENVTGTESPSWILPSDDMSHLLFRTYGQHPYVGPPDEGFLANNIYLEGSDPFLPPEWVGRSLIEGEPAGTGNNGSGSDSFIAGGSPDLNTVYFFYEGSLFPEASHLYEYREGVLSDAGTMPDGEVSTGMAAPAAQPLSVTKGQGGTIAPGAYDNEVSADGSRLFFTRMDGAGALELYVHVTAAGGLQSTALVSQSQLPGHMGEPASDGVHPMPSTEWMVGGIFEEPTGQESPPSYVFASPDGSHAFFQSVDRLTEAAPEGSTVKTYDFDLDSDTLEYIPGITGSIVTISNDGSSLVFENTATSPFELDRWTAGSAGASVTSIAKLPDVSPDACGTLVCIGPAYTSTDGSVVVFSTESPIAGFNDGGTHYEYRPSSGDETAGPLPNKQIFRYDASTNELSCISCPPSGVTPSGDAVISEAAEHDNQAGATGGLEVTTPGRGVSSDGGRVFFATVAALVPQDINGELDVYEWENGTVFLISSGRSADSSYLAGTSESGGDVFFDTSEGLAVGDTDGGYDVYDARVPRPGDSPPPSALPCQGDACQGPPSVPNLLSAPSSATFSGVGNVLGKQKSVQVAQAKGKPKHRARSRRRAKRRLMPASKRKSRKTRRARHIDAGGASVERRHR